MTHGAVEFYLMEDLGCGGVWVDESTGRPKVIAYLREGRHVGALRRDVEVFLAGLQEFFPGIQPPEVEIRTIEDQDWRVTWREFFRPERITPNLLVLPVWEEPPSDSTAHILRMDPGPAFGTGRHPSTKMCLAALEDALLPGTTRDLLDVGTGSGILAIYGAMLGASPVDAMDIDEEALEWARWNIRLNELTGSIRLSSRPLAEWSGTYSVVTANLILHTILELMPYFPKIVRPGGRLILSGLLREQFGQVQPELEDRGFAVSKILEQEEWACIVAVLKDGSVTSGIKRTPP